MIKRQVCCFLRRSIYDVAEPSINVLNIANNKYYN